ncbi:hypothetical protein ACFX2I_037151 [Malus domestica]
MAAKLGRSWVGNDCGDERSLSQKVAKILVDEIRLNGHLNVCPKRVKIVERFRVDPHARFLKRESLPS